MQTQVWSQSFQILPPHFFFSKKINILLFLCIFVFSHSSSSVFYDDPGYEWWALLCNDTENWQWHLTAPYLPVNNLPRISWAAGGQKRWGDIPWLFRRAQNHPVSFIVLANKPPSFPNSLPSVIQEPGHFLCLFLAALDSSTVRNVSLPENVAHLHWWRCLEMQKLTPQGGRGQCELWVW